MNKSIVLLLAVSALFVSCGTDKGSSAIPVENAESKMFLDDMTGGRTYLMLDDSSLDAALGDIDEVMVDDGKLFILHSVVSTGFEYEENQEISVFDMDGKFLNKIGQKGRARNEYQNIRSWCLDTRRKEVVIVDASFTVFKRFSYDGKFVSSVSIDGYAPMWDVMFCNGNLYASMLLPNQVADDIIELKDDGTFVPLLEARANMQDAGMFPQGGGIGPTHQVLDPNLESFFHLRLFDNVLYRIHDSKAEACGSFDFINSVEENQKDIYSSGDLLNTRPAETIETNSKFIVKIYEVDGDRRLTGLDHYVYDKSTKKCTRYNAEYNRDMGMIMNRFSIVGVMGDAIITIATPEGARYILENVSDIVPQSDIEKLKVLAERDNPALIIHRP